MSVRQHTFRRTVCLAAMLVAAVLSGCQRLPGKPNQADRPIRPDQVVDFQALFSGNCAGCHGADGKLGPAPPLNDPLFLTMMSEDRLKEIIGAGRTDTLMPGFDRSHPGGRLTQDQVQIVAKGLKEKWGQPFDLKAPIPDYSAQDAIRSGAKFGDSSAGLKAYGTACAKCHGTEGQGTETAGALNRPAFLGLISDQALRRLVITGRSDLGMPNFAETAGRAPGFQPLTNQNVGDIVALLASWRDKSQAAAK